MSEQELVDFISARIQYDSDGGSPLYRCEKCGHEKRSPESFWYYHYSTLASEITVFMGLGKSFYDKVVEIIQSNPATGDALEDAKRIAKDLLH